ncbi:MAG: hypothetical protein ACLP2Y_11175 [Limisphaerales bacterium]
MKQPISFGGPKCSKKTLGGHGTPLNPQMSGRPLGRLFKLQTAQVFFCQLQNKPFWLN